MTQCARNVERDLRITPCFQKMTSGGSSLLTARRRTGSVSRSPAGAAFGSRPLLGSDSTTSMHCHSCAWAVTPCRRRRLAAATTHLARCRPSQQRRSPFAVVVYSAHLCTTVESTSK